MPAGPLICIVDDDLSVRKALVGLIVSMGYSCCGHASAEAVLNSGDAERAACIVTDIHMPDMDGFALKQAVAERGYRASIVMMTARSETHLERRALDAGAICFLRKPLRADILRKCLARAIAEV